LDKGGLITDAIWSDLDDDGHQELVVVGSWMPVTIYWNSGQGLTKEIVDNSTGLYSSVYVSDINDDGQEDIILGNLGLNHVLRGDGDRLALALNDYNGDQQLDPLIIYDKDGVTQPAESTVSDLFPADVWNNTFIKNADELRSFVLINNGSRTWSKRILPRSLQSYPIGAIIESDGFLYMSGGVEDYLPITGNMSARFITKLRMEGDSFVFQNIPNLPRGSVKHLAIVDDRLIVVRNNGAVTYINLEEFR